jgi:hypothetical protein
MRFSTDYEGPPFYPDIDPRTYLVVAVFVFAALFGLQLLDELSSVTTWLAARWKKWRGVHLSRRFEGFLEARAAKRRLAHADIFETWRPEERPADWRLAPQERTRRLRGQEVASAIAVLLHDARNLAFARMEALRGTPVDQARDGLRMLLGELLDAESAFESLLTSPGQGLHAAEGLSLVPSVATTRYPLPDVMNRLIIERRYQTFLARIYQCRDRVRAGMPPAPKMEATAARATYDDWYRIGHQVHDVISEDVKMRMMQGRAYLHYGGLLTLAPCTDSLRDLMHETLKQAREEREAE